MHIVHVIYSMKLGGTEAMLLDIMKAQGALGHEVSLVVIDRDSSPALLEQASRLGRVVVIGRSGRHSRNPLILIKLNASVAALRPDVVHIHNDNTMRYLLRIPNVKYVATVHSTRTPMKALDRIDALYAISRAVRDYVKREFGRESKVIFNGIDLSAIVPRKPHLLLGGQVMGKDCEARIVCVGRLNKALKAQDLLLESLATLRERGYHKLTVDLIGEGADRKDLEEIIVRNGLHDCARLLGEIPREKVYGMLKEYDMLVCPSRVEGFGLVVAEAMAAGVPVVVSDLEGPAEIVDHGRYGEIFKSGSSGKLADAIERMLLDYERTAIKAADEGVKRAHKFDIRVTAAAYIESYKNID